MTGWSRFAGTLVLASLYLVPLEAQVPEPLASDGSRLPPDVSVLDEQRRQSLLPLIEAAQQIRGLRLKQTLAAGRQDEAASRDSFADEIPAPEQLEPVERVLRRLGMWNEPRNLHEVYLGVLSSEVAGYYDSEEGFLAIVDREDGLLADVEGLDRAVAERLEQSIWIHEVVHALQDQHFDLEAILGGEGTWFQDRSLARRALVEGDAMVMAMSYLLSAPAERFPMIDSMVGGIAGESGVNQALTPDGTGEALLEAPAFLQNTLSFPYIAGLEFILVVRRAGGQKLLDHAFLKKMPSSTEHILHPEKWLEVGDEPIRIDLPELAPLLGGRVKVLEGDLGELGVRVLLSDNVPEAGAEQVAEAAAGWGGDRLAFYLDDRDDAGVLAWVSEWDSEQDAAEVLAMLHVGFATDFEIRAEGTRVAMLAGAPDAAKGAVLQVLMSAPAVRQPGVGVDLAALGLTDADRARDLTATELAELYRDPVMLGLVKIGLGEEVAGLMEMLADDPELLAQAIEVGQQALEAGSNQAALGDLDIAALMETPAGQRLAKQMASRMAKLEATLEQGVMRIEKLRFSMTLPHDVAWQPVTIEEGLGASAPLLNVRDWTSGASVIVVGTRLPVALPLEGVVAGIVAEDLAGVEVLSQGYQVKDGQRFWQREIRKADVAMAMTQRTYLVARDLLFIAVTEPATAAPSAERMAARILDSITFGTPSSAAPSTGGGMRAEEISAGAPDGTSVPPAAPTPSATEQGPATGPVHVRGDVVRPRKVTAPPPVYPQKARDDGAEGLVMLVATIYKDGSVGEEMKVLRSPDERLTAAAIEAVREWQFEPATLHGEPIDVYYNLMLNFRLDKTE